MGEKHNSVRDAWCSYDLPENRNSAKQLIANDTLKSVNGLP